MTKQLKEIEIPFGAKDSELCDWEYTIPEGMEATIVDNKIVVKKKESGDEKIRKELVQYLKECTNLPSGQYCRADFFDWLEKQGEQKPADKVAPKFKVGDWVVYNRNDHSREVIQIYDIRDNRYYFNDNIHFSWSVKECDEKSHLWTIQDAKDGDVIVNGSNIFIFHFINDTRLIGYCHVNTDDGRFYDDIGKNECFCLIDAIVHPATKEQCEQLEKAMADAGYTFDIDKKELKKIEQKPAWSEEDEKRVESLHGWLDTLVNYIHHDTIVPLDLRRERMQQVERLKTWLKLLKEMHTWKPSDEQMKVLSKYAEQNNYDGSVLTSLYQDLKKLREE